ncbi:hypothetical protein MPTK1_2g17740 [Marchantia polymorpha subsp. ruderalis]|uniref:Uncharacterized protein n=1 Tax=Marchantia polymorpha TaxID=3197 RepID=A0A2R6WG88_MARPO|nr:hypothetical protein MARPO_0094s0042 [Marchantia polymorpha]BBN02742.1 hypothetical protein Mp_2g17740 [Marchantia polymorpha subsp. ruderalis]|eukprot:PTQ32868.1 hypothetical protein MARPO_0094s0042 [Marchantia polymorpha]
MTDTLLPPPAPEPNSKACRRRHHRTNNSLLEPIDAPVTIAWFKRRSEIAGSRPADARGCDSMSGQPLGLVRWTSGQKSRAVDSNVPSSSENRAVGPKASRQEGEVSGREWRGRRQPALERRPIAIGERRPCAHAQQLKRGGNDILLEISLKNIRQTQQHDIVRHRQLQTFFGFLPSSSPHDSFLPPTFVVTKSRVWPKMKAREEDNSVTRLRKCEPVMHRSRLIDGPTLVSSSSECKSLKCLRSFDNMPVRQTKLLRVTSNIQQSEV